MKAKELRCGEFLLLLLLVVCCTARPDGPPTAACFNMAPQHGSTAQPSSTNPVAFKWNRTIAANAVIQPGQYIQVSLEAEAGRTFKGFMIQARTGTGQATNDSTTGQRLIGTFLPEPGDDYKTLHCSTQADTAVHMNNATKLNIIALWKAPETIPDEFSFFFTVVEDYNTFWVMEESPDKLLGRTPPLPGNEFLIKIHGSLMAVAFGFILPAGIILALFYKVVWPNGFWFILHIIVMLTGVAVVIGGIIVILIHSEWTWLDTTDLNLSHQVLGIVSFATLVLNPFLGFFLLLKCCSAGTKGRKIYGIVHGTMGLIFVEAVALCAMLLGVHILRDHPHSFDETEVHNTIYSVSGLVGLVIMIIALYNGYHVRYHKDHAIPDPNEEDPLRSKDWWVRLIVGCGLLVLLLAPVVSTIYFLFQI